MEIFNIHIGEFLMIAALALVVFGPERLPEVGRFVGRQLAKLLAWQQQSPEIQMLNDVRAEFEQEIASLRDELLRTRKQLDVSQDMANLRNELRPMLSLRGNETPAAVDSPAPPAAEPAPPAAELMSPPPAANGAVSPDGLAAAVDDLPLAHPGAAAPQAVPATVRPNKLAATEPTSVLGPPAQPVAPIDALPPPPRHRRGLHDSAHLDESSLAPAEDPAAQADAPDHTLLLRLQHLMDDMQALVGELQRRDLLGVDWQLPSQTGESQKSEGSVGSGHR